MYAGRALARRAITGSARAVGVRGSVRAIHSHDSRIQDPANPEGTMREAEKQKILNREGATVSPIPDAPKWNDILASDSEAIVKAERTPVENVSELQDLTIATLEKREEVEQKMDKQIKEELDSKDATNTFKKASKAFPAGP